MSGAPHVCTIHFLKNRPMVKMGVEKGSGSGRGRLTCTFFLRIPIDGKVPQLQVTGSDCIDAMQSMYGVQSMTCSLPCDLAMLLTTSSLTRPADHQLTEASLP